MEEFPYLILLCEGLRTKCNAVQTVKPFEGNLGLDLYEQKSDANY